MIPHTSILFLFAYFLQSHFQDTKCTQIDEDLYKKLFKQQRVEQLEAIKSIQKLSHYDQQHKLILLMGEKVFTVILNSRAQIESSGYIPGVSPFPSDETTRDALSNILENTALFSEILLRLPDVTTSILKINNNWDILLQWSIAFANQVKYLLDNSTIKLLHLVSQELNHIEREENYVNPYKKVKKVKIFEDNLKVEKKKKKKAIKKGPRLFEL